MFAKQKYSRYPKISYPMVTVEEIHNEDVNRYFDDSGENVTFVTEQIEISVGQTEDKTPNQNLWVIIKIIDNYLKGERYRCLRRLGDPAKVPLPSDNNIMVGYLRYECNIDTNTNTIYRRY